MISLTTKEYEAFRSKVPEEINFEGDGYWAKGHLDKVAFWYVVHESRIPWGYLDEPMHVWAIFTGPHNRLELCSKDTPEAIPVTFARTSGSSRDAHLRSEVKERGAGHMHAWYTGGTGQ